MPSPILARADALMRRQRPSDGDADEIPVLVDAIDGEDIPVLLDIDEAGDLHASAIAATEPLPPAAIVASDAASLTDLNEPDVDALLRDLAARLQQRLVAELPRLIDATLRDYLAERAMLAGLPPDQRD